ncbi:MAG: nitroreductase family deazaflavin-dependent oxidoreductase [Deltaproteobacteria bacterium]|nr:nitroreductase family deazaflavin-dependent oxidoreductase [Deltaproteobacteria bacterium]
MSLTQIFRPRNRGQLAFITKVHRWVYTKSGGWLGANMGGIPMILLTTTGRKTGEARTTPLLSMRDGERFIVVGSNAGADKPPAWWLNLQAKPDAKVQYGRKFFTMRAAQATPEEAAVLWPRLEAMYPGYVDYKKGTTREIPIVILSPV